MFRLVILLLTPIVYFSCMSINILKHSNHKHKLNTHIHSLIKDNQLNMNLGMKIVSMKDGTCLFELNSEKLMIPASNIKLLTSGGDKGISIKKDGPFRWSSAMKTHGDIFHKDSMTIPHAYPVLKVGVEDKIKKALKYLNSFKNLNVLGRNANFEYVHIHNLFRDAKILINQLNG